MSTPNRHYTRARKIRKNRQGVYVTHEARRMRRRTAYRTALARGTEYGKDALWGAAFFIGLWVTIIAVVATGLMLIS